MILIIYLVTIFSSALASTTFYPGSVCVDRYGYILSHVDSAKFPKTPITISKRTALRLIEACEIVHGDQVHKIGKATVQKVGYKEVISPHQVFHSRFLRDPTTLSLCNREAFLLLREISNNASTMSAFLPLSLTTLSIVSLVMMV